MGSHHNNIHQKIIFERTLYSEYLGLAGRVDCIAEVNRFLCLILECCVLNRDCNKVVLTKRNKGDYINY